MRGTHKPEQGNSDNLFQRLSEYISQFDKTWIKRIKPISAESVELLKKWLCIDERDRQLPVFYQIFLEKMGADDGGFFSETLLGDAGFISRRIKSFEDWYAENEGWYADENNKAGEWQPPHFMFFDIDMGGGYAFDLSGKNFGKVMDINDDDELTGVFSENFEKLLFQCAAGYYEKYKHYLTYSIKQPCDFNVIKNMMDKYGLKKAWFSDNRHLIGYGNNVYFDCELDLYRGGCGILTGDDAKLINEIAGFLECEVDARITANQKL